MAEERAVGGRRRDPRDAPDGTAGRGASDPAPDHAEVLARVEALRKRIDDLDEQLVALLSARAACALQVGREKKQLGLEIYQPSRETEVLTHVQRVNPGPLDDAAIKRLFERIIDEARRLEREAEVRARNEHGGGPPDGEQK